MFNPRLIQWKPLRDLTVPERVLERGRIRLMAHMVSNPMVRAAKAGNWLFASLVWKPLTAVFVFGAVLAGAGGAVFASGSSLPGDRLYKVKILGEEVRARLALSPVEQFRLRALQAASRLDEADEVLRNDRVGSDERGKRLQLAMARYETHLKTLNDLSVSMEQEPSDEPEDRKVVRAVAAARSFERVLDRHDRLVESASNTKDTDAQATVAGTTGRALDLEAHVLKAARDASRYEDRMRDKADKLRKSLEKFEHKKKAVQHVDADHGHADGKDGHGEHDHDHVEAEPPAVRTAPIVNGFRTRGGASFETNTNTNTSDEAVRE